MKQMDRTRRWGWLVLVWVVALSCQPRPDAEIRTDELMEHVRYLASDELEGRSPGTRGDSLAADYIRRAFKRNGLRLVGETGFQPMEVSTEVELGLQNTCLWNRRSFVSEQDFVPLAFSGSAEVSAAVVFAGFGMHAERSGLNYSDYAGLDVGGKLVMILEGAPAVEDGAADPFADYISHRFKVLSAVDQGAAGVIFVAGEAYDPDDDIRFTKRREPPVNIPVIRMKRQSADALLEMSGWTVSRLEVEWSALSDRPIIETDTLLLQTDVQVRAARTQNIAGLLEGQNFPDDSLIIIGAHYDHLGWGGKGSGSRVPDTTAVHHGADDNASGVAGLIELAGKLQSQKKNLQNSYLFIAFGAEELGLIGSKYYTDHPLYPLEQTRAMINLDMIGRLNEDRRLSVGGVGTALEFRDILEGQNLHNLTLTLSEEGYGPSDHAAFYSKDIPVLFVSTGAHVDYHTPRDHPERINAEGMADVLHQVHAWVIGLDTMETLNYREAGPKEQTSARHRYKVTMGIMPDVSGQSNEGLKVEFVTEGRPAHRAGLQKGDVIRAMNGMAVDNIYDYMARLQSFSAGETITVEVLRDSEIMVFLVQL